MTPMEYGERVQDVLRVLIEDRFEERDSPVRSRAALSKALGHPARQYVASRFAPQGKAGVVRDLTVPDLLAFAVAIGLNAHELVARAQAIVDEEGSAGATIHHLPVPSGPPSTVTDADLIGQPSVAMPEPKNDVEGDEDPEDT